MHQCRGYSESRRRKRRRFSRARSVATSRRPRAAVSSSAGWAASASGPGPGETPMASTAAVARTIRGFIGRDSLSLSTWHISRRIAAGRLDPSIAERKRPPFDTAVLFDAPRRLRYSVRRMTTRLHRGDLPDPSRYTGAIAIDTETMGLDLNRDRLCVVQLSPGDGLAR